MEPVDVPDRETQRDLALLRAWMDHRGDAEAALAELRERGLDVLGGADEPWTVRRVQERHEFLCRCVRTFERLYRTLRTSARRMHMPMFAAEGCLGGLFAIALRLRLGEKVR